MIFRGASFNRFRKGGGKERFREKGKFSEEIRMRKWRLRRRWGQCRRERKLAPETKDGGRGKETSEALLGVLFQLLVNLEMVFCKEAVLES